MGSKKRVSLENGAGTGKKRRTSRPSPSPEVTLPSSPNQISEVEEEKKPSAQSKAKKGKKAPPAFAKPIKDRDVATEHLDSGLSDAPESANDQKGAEDPSDSELSVLIDADDPPIKKRRRSSLPSEKRATKTTKASKPKAKSGAVDMDPDQAEIKKLQSWLVKCGIRKLWGKELKGYETPKAKIKHLKEMLSDAGMTGRYSLEKANQIREQRELKADIDAVTEGAVRWGKGSGLEAEADSDSDGAERSGQPQRRLVRGAQVLDFLDSDDGAETD